MCACVCQPVLYVSLCLKAVVIWRLCELCFSFALSLSTVRGGHGVSESRDRDHSMDKGTAFHTQMHLIFAYSEIRYVYE